LTFQLILQIKGYDKIFFKFHSDKSSCSGDAIKAVNRAYHEIHKKHDEPLQDAEGGASKEQIQYSSMFAMCAVTVLLAIFQ
jgi:hypothetical protein